VQNASKVASLWHLPKCAGTFMEHSLREHLPVAPEDWLMLGHSGYNEVRKAMEKWTEEKGRRPFIICNFRHPKWRVLSEFGHATGNIITFWSRKNGAVIPWDIHSLYYDTLFIKTFEQGMDITSFVRYGALNPANNRMTRMLAGAVRAYKEGGMYEMDYSPFLMNVGENYEKREEMLALAKLHMDEMIGMVGIVERMTDTIELLEGTLGFEAGHDPINPGYDWDLTPAEEEEVLKYNDLDLRLYEYAEARFNKELDEMRRCRGQN